MNTNHTPTQIWLPTIRIHTISTFILSKFSAASSQISVSDWSCLRESRFSCRVFLFIYSLFLFLSFQRFLHHSFAFPFQIILVFLLKFIFYKNFQDTSFNFSSLFQWKMKRTDIKIHTRLSSENAVEICTPRRSVLHV